MAVSSAISMVDSHDREEPWRKAREEQEEEGGGKWRERGDETFLLKETKPVIQTEAGEMRITKWHRGWGSLMTDSKPMQIGFITMKPKSLLIPLYLDSTLILFIRQGEARIGLIYKDDFVERNVKGGDVYRIPAGSTFYIENSGEGQKLQIISSIERSDQTIFGLGTFQSYFIGGGLNPTSVLAGFDRATLATAFNVSISELDEIMTRQTKGPIVYITDDIHHDHEHKHDKELQPELSWSRFLKLENKDRLKAMTRFMNSVGGGDNNEEEGSKEPRWFEKLSRTMFGIENDKSMTGKTQAPDSYNLYTRKPDFKNDYGWSLALDAHDYHPLTHSDIGVFLVNLTAGSMMAPHINPMATECGIVLSGSGAVEIVYPNGTQAMKANVGEGDVFCVPRYFPFCQIASTTGPFEFFGFTTSAHKNRPQFLVGAGSILRTMSGPQLAAGFGLTEERFREISEAQLQSTIFPSAAAAPADKVNKM
ncbi:vicilin-like seed storage protein At2g28490 [Impatiens glandulifera]|uniref:vicilin-like seed storage protein At2g28490 n=1 Tax=Impatiens glandulifera TaxID=253017 RepID=UPI001FB16727|nr:vicilin-like seed storage protein At2g28490 [Impatiens glandulifera]